VIILLLQFICRNRSFDGFKILAVPGLSHINSGKDTAMYAYYRGLNYWLTFYFNSESDILKQESYEYAIKYAHLAPDIT
jgi:hypothetical protein